MHSEKTKQMTIDCNLIMSKSRRYFRIRIRCYALQAFQTEKNNNNKLDLYWMCTNVSVYIWSILCIWYLLLFINILFQPGEPFIFFWAWIAWIDASCHHLFTQCQRLNQHLINLTDEIDEKSNINYSPWHVSATVPQLWPVQIRLFVCVNIFVHISFLSQPRQKSAIKMWRKQTKMPNWNLRCSNAKSTRNCCIKRNLCWPRDNNCGLRAADESMRIENIINCREISFANHAENEAHFF